MKVLLEIVADQSKAAIEVRRLRDAVAQFRKELSKEGVGAERVTQLNKELVRTNVEISKLTEQQKNLNREFKQANVPKDSITGLRLEYAKLTDQVNNLSKAERNSAFGKGLQSKAASIKAEITGVEEAMGRFTGNVGNYRKSLLSVGDLLTGGLATGGVVVGVQAVIGAMKAGVNQAIQYEKALSNLAALTGVTGEGLQKLDGVARGLQEIEVNGQRIVNTGPEIVEALKLVGGARPELLQDAEALGDVAKQAIVLSKASGDDLKSSVEAVTTTLGQFKLQSSDSGRVVNELAAGAKEGAAEIPQITDALNEFGTVAEISNASTSNSIALIELLADRQLKGAEAGTQLRNILSKLASADILPANAQAQFQRLGIDINVLKDATLPLETRLRELGKAQGDLSALTKIFGLENLQAATIITSGLDKYHDLNEAVQGTSEAYRQAGINADNTASKIENFQKGALNKLEQTFTGTASAGGFLVDTLDFLVQKMDLFGAVTDLAIGPSRKLFNSISEFVEGFNQRGLAAIFDPLNVFGDKAKKGLQGLDLGALRANVDLTTGAVLEQKPVTGDATDKLLSEANKLINTGATKEAGNTISDLTQKVKLLKAEIAKTDPGSDKFKELSAQLKEAKKELRDEKVQAGIIDPKKTKEGVEVSANSIDFFKEQISNLNKVLNNTPEDSPLLAKLTEQIKTAEGNLAQLEKKLKELKEGKPEEVAPTLDQINQDLKSNAGFGSTFKEDVGLTDEQRLKIVEDNQFRQDQEVENAEFTLSVNQALTDKLIDLTKEEQKAKEDAAEEEKKRRGELAEEAKKAAIDVAQAVSDALFNIQKDKADREKSAALEALDAQTADKVKKAQGDQAKIDKIEKDAAKKRVDIEKKAAREQKEVALKQAFINTGLAVLKVFATTGPPLSFVLAAATALIGAAQIATIAKQQFAGGGVAKKLGTGIVRERPNAPTTAKGDNILAYLKAGEMVLNEVQQMRVKAMAGPDVFHRAGVPMYAGGGVVHSLVTPQQAAFANSVVTFAEGGVFQNAPQIAPPPQASGSSERVVVVETRIRPEDVKLIARTIATDVADSSQRAIAEGLNDANRRNEREESLAKNRKQ